MTECCQYYCYHFLFGVGVIEGTEVGTENSLGSIGALQVMAKNNVSHTYIMNFYRDEHVITNLLSLSPTHVE